MDILKLLQNEPWRSGKGQPRSILDPGWDPAKQDYCDGELDWDTAAGAWWCKKCGFIRQASYTLHRPVTFPSETAKTGWMRFFEDRLKRGFTPQQVLEQALYVAGSALQKAVDVHPEKLGEFVEKM